MKLTITQNGPAAEPLGGPTGVGIFKYDFPSTSDMYDRHILERFEPDKETESHSLLMIPFSVVNDGATPVPLEMLPVKFTLVRKDPTLGNVLEKWFTLELPCVAAEVGGGVYQREARTQDDGVFVDMTKCPTVGDYECTLQPDGGKPVTLTFTRTIAAATKFAISALPPLVTILPVSTPPGARVATVRNRMVVEQF